MAEGNVKVRVSALRGLCKCGHTRGEHPLMKEGQCAANGCHCGVFQEAAPDPLAVAERAAAAPAGSDAAIDALAEIVRLLNSLSEVERQASLAYITSRYAGPLS